jgi:hypothetical protein
MLASFHAPVSSRILCFSVREGKTLLSTCCSQPSYFFNSM